MPTRRLLPMTIFYGFLLLANIIISTALAGPVWAHNNDIVSVRLFEAHRPVVSLKILPPFDLILPDHRKTIVVSTQASVEHENIYLRKKGSRELSVIFSSSKLCIAGHDFKPLLLAITATTVRRQYRGNVLLSVGADGCLEIINKVSLPDYIEGVVASEAPGGAPIEMLKAQAVLAQTLMRCHRKINTIGDSTESQCYLGSSLCTEKSRTAVLSVRDKQLSYQGLPVTVYYHSTCAGGTSNGAQFFHIAANKLPYSSGVICKNCRNSPFWQTTSNCIPHNLFAKEFGPSTPEVREKDTVGRPLAIKLGNGQIISGYDFWIRLGRNFGWDKAPGTRFKLLTTSNGDCIIESTGAGHGIGLCQWGAAELAKKGKTYREILRYYFPACEVL